MVKIDSDISIADGTQMQDNFDQIYTSIMPTYHMITIHVPPTSDNKFQFAVLLQKYSDTYAFENINVDKYLWIELFNASSYTAWLGPARIDLTTLMKQEENGDIEIGQIVELISPEVTREEEDQDDWLVAGVLPRNGFAACILKGYRLLDFYEINHKNYTPDITITST